MVPGLLRAGPILGTLHIVLGFVPRVIHRRAHGWGYQHPCLCRQTLKQTGGGMTGRAVPDQSETAE